MARQKVEVDKVKLQAAIDQAEVNGPLSGRSALWSEVARIYGTLDPEHPVTPAVVYLRFVEMGLICQTQSGKKGHMSEELKAKMREARKGVVVTRRSRASKLAGLEGAEEHFKRLREITPERFQTLVDKVEKGSLSAAIKLMCVQCMGFEAKYVWDCKGISCPMYLHRPYQKPTDSDGDKTGEVVDVEPEVD